jgi:RNA polymerase sigma-70 factor (ECF subfamily)
MKNQDLKTEQKLLEKAQKNSKDFEALYKYFVDDVYRFSYSILNNRHDAEDITSQVFIAFYKKLNEFEWQNISLKYWFFTTSKNLCYTKFRKKPEVEYNDEIHSENFQEVSFVDEIMNRDLLEKVKEEIQKLSPAEQTVINLRIWEGMQFSEIAELDGMKLSTCKLRFYRAIEKVKKSLEERKVMHAVALPFLFTAIRDAGNLEVYHASASLMGAGATIILGKTAMTTLGSLLSSLQAAAATQVGTAAIVTTATVATIGGGYVAYEKVYLEPEREAVVTEVLKPEEREINGIVSITPTTTFIPTATEEPAPTVTATSTPTPVSPGIIEGSLGYPSEQIPPLTICAINISTNALKCTENIITDSRFTYYKGYQLSLTPGTYQIYALDKNSSQPDYRAYYSEFVKCGMSINCKSHKPINVLVQSGRLVRNIDPKDWYNY